MAARKKKATTGSKKIDRHIEARRDQLGVKAAQARKKQAEQIKRSRKKSASAKKG